MKASKSQKDAIEYLFNEAKKHLSNNSMENSLNFVNLKAPTGSGKTFIIFEFIKQLRQNFLNNANIKLVFVVCTVSTSDLPGQIYRKFNEYKEHDNEIEIEHIQSPSVQSSGRKINEQDFTIKVKRNKIYILGGASFRKNTIMKEQNVFESFKNQIKLQNYQLIYIRDEAHIGDIETKNNKDFKNFEEEIQRAATFIVKTTATPDNFSKIYEITEDDLKNDNPLLIKTSREFNAGFDEKQIVDSKIILKTACQKFKEIKKQYKENPYLSLIYPAMLIQVRNENKEESEKFHEDINNFIEIIKNEGLNYFKYFGENDTESNLKGAKNWKLEDVSKNLSPVDVIIFKVGPATGWDIPRACMLVQLREVSSPNLTIQTLGRIKRNPNPLLINNWRNNRDHIGLKFFIYSSNLDKKIDDYHSKIYTLKKENKSLKIIVGEHEFPKGFDKNTSLINNPTFLEQYKPEVFKILADFINCDYEQYEENKPQSQNIIEILTTKNLHFFYKKEINNQSYSLNKKIYESSQIYKNFLEKIDEWNERKNHYISGFLKTYGETQKQAEYEIYNIVELSEIVIDLKNKYQKYFNSFLINTIESSFYNMIVSKFSVNNKGIKPFKISLNMFWFLFLEQKIFEIKKIFNKTLEKIKNEKFTYKINKVNLPQEQIFKFYVQNGKDSSILNNKHAEIDDFFTHESACKNQKIIKESSKQSNKDLIPLDSDTEIEFFQILKKYNKKNQEKSRKNMAEIFWTKAKVDVENPSLNYIDNEGMLKKIYPDFIIGKRDESNDLKVSHQFFIEIKNSQSDINPQKTEVILDSFLDFFLGYRNYQQKTINSPHITAMVCYIDTITKKEDLECYGYSTIESLNKKISQKSISEIDRCATNVSNSYEKCKLRRLAENSKNSQENRSKHFIKLNEIMDSIYES
ncbi:DEAD/DEAH box helicase family protein [Mycoplasma sp. 'Moose RK']|uniref:DEAD/DEAH box helicase family protein n=1 Tax=Mycoplasma sp. 'Moose RK' TaxID=2780095 RepID=UPI0018C2DDE6|nr:DEAD/DEAH box helicase family protein [Mycoplasma sp. 'Moose RK']MBG0730845.1 DEAD/DEAH box helicase family protein [Mycoplasma sp. 'Moose RK']